jgi:acetyl-CoA carboxylase carboxyltransferase component
VFDGGEDGVELDLNNALKIKNFASFASDNGLPLVNFINVKGIKQDLKTASTSVMVELMNALYNLSNSARISVVYGKAVGLGYSLFASRQFGNAYTYAFVDAKISLLDGDAGAFVEFSTVDSSKLDELKEKYAEIEDAFNSAKIGCIDNVIEPQFVRQYVISALQMIIR